MPYDAARTPSLIACLQKEPGREFLASRLQDRTTVPKKFVRRALTLDREQDARIPMAGVTMVQKGGLWHYSWTGAQRQANPAPQSQTETLPNREGRLILRGGQEAPWNDRRRGPMSISDDVKRYYEEAGISAVVPFRCRHLQECKRTCSNFIEAQEAYIGREYEKGTLPRRLLFLSLDAGQSEDTTPDKRTIEGVRRTEEKSRHDETSQRRDRPHWYYTHSLALILLRTFKPDLAFADVHRYFAHTTSVKCCMNKLGQAMADPVMYRHCRQYIRPEVVALRPDILVTQGVKAKIAIEKSFDASADLQRGGHTFLEFQGRKVLWIPTYHPRNGRFHTLFKEHSNRWADIVRRFRDESTAV